MLIARLRFRLGAFRCVCRRPARRGYLCFCKIHSDPSLPVFSGGGAPCGAWAGGMGDWAAPPIPLALSSSPAVLLLCINPPARPGPPDAHGTVGALSPAPLARDAVAPP